MNRQRVASLVHEGGFLQSEQYPARLVSRDLSHLFHRRSAKTVHRAEQPQSKAPRGNKLFSSLDTRCRGGLQARHMLGTISRAKNFEDVPRVFAQQAKATKPCHLGLLLTTSSRRAPLHSTMLAQQPHSTRVSVHLSVPIQVRAVLRWQDGASSRFDNVRGMRSRNVSGKHNNVFISSLFLPSFTPKYCIRVATARFGVGRARPAQCLETLGRGGANCAHQAPRHPGLLARVALLARPASTNQGQPESARSGEETGCPFSNLWPNLSRTALASAIISLSSSMKPAITLKR